MYLIPDALAETIVEVWEDEGAAWLRSLPGLLDEYARRWNLVVGPPLEPLSYNYVAPATRSDGSEVVLKVGLPRDAGYMALHLSCQTEEAALGAAILAAVVVGDLKSLPAAGRLVRCEGEGVI